MSRAALFLSALATATALHVPAAVGRPAISTARGIAVQPRMSAAALPPLAPSERPSKVASAVAKAVRVAAVAAGTLAVPSMLLASTGAAEHLHLGQKLALYVQKFGLPDWATLVLISMLPAIELRGGVPVGNWMGLSPWATFVICVVGNMLPIAPMLLALRSAWFKRLAAPLLSRAEKKLAGLPSGQSRTLALTLFVGVPAPGTGAWTGAIIAYLLDMPFVTAMTSILAGVVLAGVIMTILTLAGKTGALIALGALVAGGLGAIASSARSEKKEAGDDADDGTAASE